MRKQSKSVVFAMALMTGILSGCAIDPSRPSASTHATDDWANAAIALRTEQWEAAEAPLARLVQQDLRNGHLQFLYALAQENSARDADRAKLDLAAVGYSNAARFSPGNFWALMRLGALDLERQDYTQAQAHFAAAALDQPQRWEAFYALGMASYYREDLPVLKLATQRAQQLAPDDTNVLRLSALSMAAQGNLAATAMAQRAVAPVADTPDGQYFLRRVAEFTNDANSYSPPADTGVTQVYDYSGVNTENPPAPTQVVVDVTILLNSKLDEERRGVNLFDGLRVLYGYNNALSQFSDSFGRQSTRTITSQISSPQLDYSLNLFNDSGQYYSVVARPSITAHIGRESQFFAGRTVNVQVSGVNLGQLQPIDVGVQLTVTPEIIDNEKITFRVDASRSFLSQQQAGTFEKSLTLFRQSVGTTANLAFGQTLVLSALSEQVQDKSFSRVPFIRYIPILNWFTGSSDVTRREESLLILVTPSLPLSYEQVQSADKRTQEVEQLLALWNQRVDPNTNIPAILQRLKQSPWLRAPKRGDLHLASLENSSIAMQEAIEENLFLAKH